MHQPIKWWTGLFPLAAIWIAGTGFKTEGIEADLAGKARAAVGALSADVVNAPQVVAAGRDIRLTGGGFTPGSAEQAARSVDNSYGVRLVDVSLEAIASAKPYLFSAKNTGAQMVLDGNVPLPSVRAKLAAAAKAAAPAATIVDSTKYASGAPGNYEAAAAYAIAQASKLRNGVASISDGAYSISGEASSAANYDEAMAATRQLLQGLTLAKADILAPELKPYVWSATRNAQGVTLTGAAPSAQARDAIAARAATAFPGATITNQMQIARGAPAGDFAAAASYGLGELGKLQGGAVSLSDANYSISGTAPTTAAYDAALAATQQLPQGLKLAKAEIQPAEVKPYVWSATRDANGVTLTGFAPNEAVRTAIAARAASAFPGARIDNKMQIARGAPAGDYAATAAYGLGELGKLQGGSVSLSDGNYSISGAAPNVAAYDAALAATKQLPQGLKLAKAEILPPEVKPYMWSAAREAGGLTLTGFAPSEAARDAIAASAASAFPGVRIDNKLQIARGAPVGDFGAATKFALAELGKLSDGKASFADGKFSLTGTGKAGVTNASAGADARTGLPQGFSVATIDLKEGLISPYVFNAARSDGKLALTGYYPDQKAHQDIVAAAKSRFPNDAIDDQLVQGRGAPGDFAAAISAGFGSLSRLASGALGLSGSNLTLRGEAFYDKAASQIRGAFDDATPQGYRAQSEITVRAVGSQLDAASCQPQLTGLLSKGKILFETARADIQKDSAALLDQIAAVALRCKGSEIEVAGHTDSEGAPDRNLNLSKRRAQAVVDYLVDAGVEGNRISAVGYGETRPIASNDTAEGRAQNRRIEMSVK